METDSGSTSEEGRHGVDNVVPFPRDWIGPADQLVPFGRRGQMELGVQGQDAPDREEEPVRALPPDAFWDEGAAALHEAIAAPPGLIDDLLGCSGADEDERRATPRERLTATAPRSTARAPRLIARAPRLIALKALAAQLALPTRLRRVGLRSWRSAADARRSTGGLARGVGGLRHRALDAPGRSDLSAAHGRRRPEHTGFVLLGATLCSLMLAGTLVMIVKDDGGPGAAHLHVRAAAELHTGPMPVAAIGTDSQRTFSRQALAQVLASADRHRLAAAARRTPRRDAKAPSGATDGSPGTSAEAGAGGGAAGSSTAVTGTGADAGASSSTAQETSAATSASDSEASGPIGAGSPFGPGETGSTSG